MTRFFLSLIIIFAAFLSLYNLGAFAFQDFDEAIYARVFHESLVREDLINFTFLGNPWIDKPPLYFWLARISTSLFTESEFSLRLPSALMTILSIFLVFKISLTLQGEALRSKTAVLSSLILLSTALFISVGRKISLDVPVTFFILLSYYAFLQGKEKPLWFIIFALGLAGAVLTKSFIGLLIIPVILLNSLVYKQWSFLKNIWFWSGLFLSALLIIPWHIIETVKYGSRFWQLYFFNVGNRLAGQAFLGPGGTISEDVKGLLISTNPWFLATVILSTIYILTDKKKIFKNKFFIANMLTTIFLIFFFLLPQNRRETYFIPSLPFMALTLASLFTQLYRKFPKFTLPVFFLLFVVALLNTTFSIFSTKERDILLQPIQKLSRQEIAEEEKKVGILAATTPEKKLYIYRWQFYPTLLYYSQKDNLYKVNTPENLPQHGWLLIPKPILSSLTTLPQNKVIYDGNAAVLIQLK